jgi:hypothetical protein
VPSVGNPRAMTFQAPLLSSEEVRTQHRQMLALLGGAGDALWIPDDGLSQTELNARCIWGAAAGRGEALAVHGSYGGHQRSFSFVERL